MRHPLHNELHRMATDRWLRGGVRSVLRACWIAVCVCCIGLGASLIWGWPLQLEWLGAAALACIAAALALMLRPAMRPTEAARRLDRRFGLHEQLATAAEVAATNPPAGTIEAELVRRATSTAQGLRRQLGRRQRGPWTELLTLLALLLVVAGLLLLSGVGAPWLAGFAGPLPPLPRAANPEDLFPEEPPPAGQEGDQTVPGAGDQTVPGAGDQLMPGAGEGQSGESGEAGGSPQAGTSPADARTLAELADALRDQGATRPAAEALDRGDPAGAAQELRELADQAGQLSQRSRDDLADRLREAAGNLRQSNPQMSDQLRQSAGGLEGSDQEASEALDGLAEQLDQLGQGMAGSGSQQGEGQTGEGQGGQGSNGTEPGQQGEGQGSGAGNAAGGRQRPVQPERLGVEGQAVELEAEGSGQSAAEPAQPGTTMPGGTGSTAGGDTRNMGAAGPDPLRIPLDERDVVQEYFNP